MFNFFKRAKPKPPVVKKNRRSGASSSNLHDDFPEESQLPDIVEGNSQTDWDLWETSAMALDSQMQPLSPTASVRLKDEKEHSQFDELPPDAFSSITRNRG